MMMAALAEANADFDYDELARRLLIQLVRKLAAERAAVPPEPSADPDVVAELEHELASAWTKHGMLAEENFRLREQLRSARQSLAMARERVRRLPITADLDNSEVVLLQRLLTPAVDEELDRPARTRGTVAGWLGPDG